MVKISSPKRAGKQNSQKGLAMPCPFCIHAFLNQLETLLRAEN
jgi:hypothetical protein